MKVSALISKPGRSSSFNFPRGLLYSTTASSAPKPAKPRDSLYRRISPLGHSAVSIVPVLDQWVEEGRHVKKDELQHIIKELRRYSRSKHALEVSHWMSDRRHFKLSFRDIVVRLDLVSKVHGAAQAESYFTNMEEQMKTTEVYRVLLNCYARQKSVEKAEAIMHKMRDLGFAMTIECYNTMLNLYCQTDKQDKLDALIHEMEEKYIKYNKFTFSILLTMHAEASDIEGMERILQKMESDPKVILDWDSYSIAGNCFIKAGLFEKALLMLKKSEGLITSKKRTFALNYLLTQYATLGKKDEVFRLWELLKEKENLYNKSYICMITSLLKLDDIESAEKIFDEWESSELCYDFRIPNFLIGAYCRKGLMEKAEAFIIRAKLKGGKPIPPTWYYLATGYIGTEKMQKAVEFMKKAVSAFEPGWKPSKISLFACLEYLKEKDDVVEAEEFLRLLLDKGVFSSDMYDKLLDDMKTGYDLQMEIL